MSEENNEHGPDLTQGVALSQLEEGTPLVGSVEGDPVLVVKKQDQIYAIGARCSHYGAPLQEGLIVGETIRCPWHHAAFDLNSGDAIGAPAFESTGCYPVEIDGFHFRVLPKEEAAEPSSQAGPASVVMVGAGAAAAAAAETLRNEGYGGAITMIGAEASGPVDRPNLSKDYLAGEAPEEWIPLGGGAAHWRELDVEVVVADPVTSIDRDDQSVRTESGQRFSYERLVIATGCEPIVPPMGGLESATYFTLRSLEDTQRIIEAAEDSSRALVVGASFIGLEVAASLRNRGLEVTVVAPESLPLAGIFGDDIGELIRSVHQAQGVNFEMGAKVENLDDGRARLTNGTETSFDFLVLGVGVQPRTELAAAAGLEVDDGVVVDETLRTEDPAIYAVGDVARYPDPISGHSARIEHWVHAQRQAQTASRNMLDDPQPFRDVPFFWSRHFGLTLHYIGHAPEFDRVCVKGSITDRDATVGYLLDDQVVAVATIGRALDGLRAEWALGDGDQARLRELVGC